MMVKYHSFLTHIIFIDSPGLKKIRQRVLKFWDQLKRSLVKNSVSTLSLYSDEAKRLWIECWTAVAQSDNDFSPPHILLEILLILPSSAQNFPSVGLVTQVIVVVLNQMMQPPDQHHPLPEKLRLLNIISRVFRDRLQGENPDCRNNKSEFLLTISKIKNDFDEIVCDLLKIKMNADSKRAVRETMGRIADIEAYETFVRGIQFVDEAAANLHEKPWLGWIYSPIIGWLTSPVWLEFPPLTSTYETSEEYVETLTRVWTALTFYWGAGALWPSCHFKRDENICGQPMLYGCNGSGVFCSSHNCSSPAKWKCFHYGHDGICGSCLRHKQDDLLGAPSKHASTDVYDGLVTRESCRRGGNVFQISGFQSRKPPAIAPNWGTTYRLPVAGLVAVLRLDAPQQPLSRKMKLQWAELCQTGNPGTFETAYRQKG